MKKMILLSLFSLSSIALFGMEHDITAYISYHMNRHLGLGAEYGWAIISDESADSGIRIVMDFGTGIQGFNKDDVSMDFWTDIALIIKKFDWLWYYFSGGGKVRVHYPWQGSYGLVLGFGAEIPISQYFIKAGLVMNILTKDPPHENSGIVIGMGIRF